MNQKLLVATFLLIFWNASVKGQVAPPCPTPPPPGAESCQTACVYCDFDGYMGINNGTPSGGNTVCGAIAIHNDQWFGFVAGTSSITIDILTSNCLNGDGLQAAFFDNCANDAITCNPGSGGGAGIPLTLSYSGFVPGQTYFLMIDGWIGDVCDYEIDVTNGSVSPPPPGIPEQPQGPTMVCPGATVVYSIPPVDGAGYYHWITPPGSSINGGGNNVNIPAPEGTSITVTFGNAGGSVCVRVGNACFAPTQACLGVVNQPIPPTIKPDVIVCFEDLPYVWDEEPFTSLSNPGTFTLNSTPYASYLGCDSTIRQKITIKNQISTNIGFQYICEDECYIINNNSYCNTGGPFQETFQSYQECDSIVRFSVVKIPVLAVIPQPIPPIDCASPTEIITSTGSTTGPNVTYTWTNSSWSPVGNQSTYTANMGGTYNLIVTNSGGNKVCRDTATVSVTADLTPPGVTASGGVIGCLASNQTVTLMASSMTNGVNYLWSGPGIIPANQNQQNPVVDTPGTYVVIVTNPVNHCTSTETVQVIADNTPPQAMAAGGTITCIDPIVQINGSTNVPDASFLWSGPGINISNQNLEDPTVSVSGNYAVTVTNNLNGCTSTATAMVDQDTDVPIADAGNDQTINCLQLFVTLNGSGDAGGAPIAFNWAGPGINSGNQNLPAPQVDTPGTYILTITNTLNGCTQSDTVLVDASLAAPISEAGLDSTITCIVTSVPLNGGNSSQGPGFSALWTGPGITPANESLYTPVVDQPGLYTLTITNTLNGCTSLDTVTISINTDPPTADAGADQMLTCGTPGVTLNGNGTPTNVTYFWTGPGIGSNNQTQQNPLITIDGVYTLRVTDPVNGCTHTDQVEVFQDSDVPDANAGNDLVLNCAVFTVDLDGSGSSTGPDILYSWTGPGINSSNDTLQSPTGINLPGTYTLVVLNTSNGCENTDVVVVSIDTLAPLANAGPDLILNCFNNTLDSLNALGSNTGTNFQILWSGPDINAGNEQSITPGVSIPGTYTLLVTNTINSCTSTDMALVNLNTTPPVADAGGDAIIDCIVTSTSIGGNSSSGPNFYYTWTGPGITSGNETQPTPSVNLSGDYTLIVIDSVNGCTANDMVTVTLNAVYPNTDAGPDQTITCYDPTITLDGSNSSAGPEFQYFWTGPGIGPGNQNQPTPVINQPGTYILDITNTTNSCVTSDTVVVLENTTVPVASAGQDRILDCQVLSVTLNGNNSSTGSGFIYFWTGAAITPATDTLLNPMVNQAGTYTLLVTNTVNGCTAQDNVVVTQDITAPIANAGASITLTCAQSSLPLNGSGSSSGPPFEYLWQGPDINTGNFNQQNPMVSDSGTYILIVTNINNHCTATDSVYVALDGDFPLTEAGPEQILNCVVDTVQLDGSLSLSGPGITYSWSGPGIVTGTGNGTTPLVTLPGNYILTVSNTSNGCSNSDAVTVNEDVLSPTADAGDNQILTCITVNGVTLSSLNSSQGPEFSILWSGPDINPGNATQPEPQVSVSGTYTLVVTNTNNGCTAADDVQVNLDQNLPTASAGSDRTITCNVPSVNLDGTGSTLGGTVSIQWSGPGIDAGNETDLTPSVGEPGVYTIVVTNNQNGCSSSDIVTVFLDIEQPVAIITTDTITCANPEVSISVSSSLPNSTFFWAGPDVNIGNQTLAQFLIDEPGSYSVTVTAPNGCTGTQNAIVAVDSDFPDGAAEGTVLNCANNSTSIINGDVDTPGATFYWTGPNNFTSNELSPEVTQPGVYIFNITGDNGCKRTIEVDVTGNFIQPTINASLPELLDCNTPSITINGSGSSTGAQYTYLWTTLDGNILSGSTTLTPLVNEPGTYTLLITNNNNGCTNSRDVLVTNDPAVPTGFLLTVRDIPCFGGDNGYIAVNNLIGGTPPYQFSLNGAPPSGTTQFAGLLAGEYSLFMTDANGCLLDTLVTIDEPGQLLVDLGGDQEILLGESISVEAVIAAPTNPVTSIIWSPAAPCDTVAGAPTCLEYSTTPESSYYQRITVTDSNGCVSEDLILIQVRKDRYIYVPNVFQPNASNPFNSILMIHGNISIEKVKRWSIYNRWGEAVWDVANFQPDDPAYSWDGRFRGQECSPGVFTWVAEVEFIDGEVIMFTGDVAIVK